MTNGSDPVPAPAGLENLFGARGILTTACGGLVTAFVQASGFLVLWQVPLNNACFHHLVSLYVALNMSDDVLSVFDKVYICRGSF